MKWRFVRSTLFLFAVIGIHLSTGYDTPKTVNRYPDDDPYYPPYGPLATSPTTKSSIAVTSSVVTSTRQRNFAEPVFIFYLEKLSTGITISLFHRLQVLKFLHKSHQCTMAVMASKVVWAYQAALAFKKDRARLCWLLPREINSLSWSYGQPTLRSIRLSPLDFQTTIKWATTAWLNALWSTAESMFTCQETTPANQTFVSKTYSNNCSFLLINWRMFGYFFIDSQLADWMWPAPSTWTAICIANLNARRSLSSVRKKWTHLKCTTCFWLEGRLQTMVSRITGERKQFQLVRSNYRKRGSLVPTKVTSHFPIFSQCRAITLNDLLWFRHVG